METPVTRSGLVGERRAIALLALGFFTTLFLIVALAQGGAWGRCFGAMAATYGVTFFALAAEYFWARWFALGIATSGMTMALLGLVTSGWNMALVIWGAIHAMVYLPLLGQRMADRYENQSAWRERYHLDDGAVKRIRRAVHSTATALPTLIFYTLAPRQDQGLLWGLAALAVLGAGGLLRLRTWGVLALGAAAVWVGFDALLAAPATLAAGADPLGLAAALQGFGLFSAAALSLAFAPFAIPAWRYLRRP